MTGSHHATNYQSPLTLAEWGRERAVTMVAMAYAIQGRKQAFGRDAERSDLLRDGFTNAEVDGCFAAACRAVETGVLRLPLSGREAA